MRTLIHISDLHFGRTMPALVKGLRASILATAPDLVVVSGDLTQRARRSEFNEALDFLNSFPFPKVVVAGNHDVPLYDLFNRIFRPLARFRSGIAASVPMRYRDDMIHVEGMTSAHGWTSKHGKWKSREVKQLASIWAGDTDETFRVLVNHHGLRLTPDLAALRPDLLLSGHAHQSTLEIHNENGWSSLRLQAGTAVSSRVRGEPNSFHRLRIPHREEVYIETLQWIDKREEFAILEERQLTKNAGVWTISSSRPGDRLP